MKHIHIECLPDEHLIKKLGFTRKFITHHQGKSKVFHVINKCENQIAMVDEDPGSAKTSYEKSLKFIEDVDGISCFSDKSGNRIFVLKGKLEDWIINICKREKINLSKFGLSADGDSLHEEINNKLSNFDKLLAELEENKCSSINTLKSRLTQK